MSLILKAHNCLDINVSHNFSLKTMGSTSITTSFYRLSFDQSHLTWLANIMIVYTAHGYNKMKLLPSLVLTGDQWTADFQFMQL